ncbi:MAG: helix-turn-helix transcriptional regulator [Coriobacteriales bacterium]|nr:helix-turn-helix transcriptional regulator [Coriobacteriales bacterium]
MAQMDTSIFDAKKELASFYQRHFDELCNSCLEVSSRLFQWSPLNTLPFEERHEWVRAGFTAVINDMLGEEMPHRGRVYFPRVSELSDIAFFGMADVLDSCERALLPDEAVLPLLFDDYAQEPQKLYALLLELRNAQNKMIHARTYQQMEDFENYVHFACTQAVEDERDQIEKAVYRRFYLALKSLQDKTADIYEYAKSCSIDNLGLCTEITQLKMMEADLLSEVFRLSPNVESGRGARKQTGVNAFRNYCKTLGLTTRETEVAELIAQGLSNAEVAQSLGIATSTVKNYLARVLSKTGCKSRSQLASFAAEYGMFDG